MIGHERAREGTKRFDRQERQDFSTADGAESRSYIGADPDWAG